MVLKNFPKSNYHTVIHLLHDRENFERSHINLPWITMDKFSPSRPITIKLQVIVLQIV